MDVGGCPAGPLDGISVIALTTVMFGPFCTQILGEMGASIIKVEPPEGDIGRQTGARQTAPLGASCELLNAVMALCLGKLQNAAPARLDVRLCSRASGGSPCR